MKRLLLLLMIVSSIATNAQELKELTLEDAIIGRWSYLYPERIEYFDWIPGEDSYLIYGKQDDNILYKATAPNFNEEPLIRRGNFNKLLKTVSEDTLRSLARIELVDNESFRFQTSTNVFTYNFKSKNLKKGITLEGNEEHIEWSPAGDKFAYTVENNVYVKTKERADRVTSETDKGVVCGQAVHRVEFGITKGLFWSPKGNALAFYRNDQTMVTDYPLVDISARPATVKNTKYPMAGMKSEEVTIGVMNFKSGDLIYLNTGEPKEQYLTNIAWSPDEKFIYVAVLNRDQNHMKLNRYDAKNGEFDKTLFEEKHEKYVQPLNPIQFLPNDDEKFIWQSQRDGFNHLYLYDIDGKMLKQITKGEELVTSVIGFDEKGKKVLVQTTSENGLSRAIKWVTINNGKASLVSKKEGTTNVKPSPTGNYFYSVYIDLTTPADYAITNAAGGEIKSLLKPSDPTKKYNVGKTELFQIKNKDGLDLNARIIKPHDFDPKKKYPVLVYVYNGPNVQLLNNRWLGGAALWMHYFANKGNLVFTVDGRGSANRGLAFENAIFRQCGEVEIEDQLAGVNYLKSLAYVDTNKLAVHGWSYGGFMTTSLMLKTPGVFDVGVSGGGVMDWKYYEVMYTERYMDTPETNPEGYEKTSLLNKTDKLEGKLLMIHDSEDDTVLPQHIEDFLKKCVKTGTQVDYFYYVGHPHNVRGRDRVHLMEKVLTYIENNW